MPKRPWMVNRVALVAAMLLGLAIAALQRYATLPTVEGRLVLGVLLGGVLGCVLALLQQCGDP